VRVRLAFPPFDWSSIRTPVLPLPKGEGRGEGKGTVRKPGLHHVPKLCCRSTREYRQRGRILFTDDTFRKMFSVPAGESGVGSGAVAKPAPRIGAAVARVSDTIPKVRSKNGFCRVKKATKDGLSFQNSDEVMLARE
jgi:hypothetical protein